MGKLLAAYLMPHPAVLIPEIGQGEEKKLKKTADAIKRAAKEIKELAPDNIIVITPHGAAFMGALSVFGGKLAQKTMEEMDAPDVWLSLETNQCFHRLKRPATPGNWASYYEQFGLTTAVCTPHLISREHLSLKLSLCPGFVSKRDTEVYGECIRAIEKARAALLL